MALHRVVNGERVEIPLEEEVEIQAEWEKNRLEKEQKKEDLAAKEKLRLDSMEKLRSSIGLTEEEANLLFGGKNG